MRREIIDLRLSIEELQELPMYHWKELLRERRKQVKLQLKRFQEASEFLEIATAGDLRERALRYKEVVSKRVGRDEKVSHWVRDLNPSEEKKKEKKKEREKKEDEKI